MSRWFYDTLYDPVEVYLAEVKVGVIEDRIIVDLHHHILAAYPLCKEDTQSRMLQIKRIISDGEIIRLINEQEKKV